jgi:hypothetical protein
MIIDNILSYIFSTFGLFHYLSHPVTWQLVSFPLSGLKAPLVLSLSACREYRSTRLRQGLAGPVGTEGREWRDGADCEVGGIVAGQSVKEGDPSSSSSSSIDVS